MSGRSCHHVTRQTRSFLRFRDRQFNTPRRYRTRGRNRHRNGRYNFRYPQGRYRQVIRRNGMRQEAYSFTSDRRTNGSGRLHGRRKSFDNKLFSCELSIFQDRTSSISINIVQFMVSSDMPARYFKGSVPRFTCALPAFFRGPP